MTRLVWRSSILLHKSCQIHLPGPQPAVFPPYPRRGRPICCRPEKRWSKQGWGIWELANSKVGCDPVVGKTSGSIAHSAHRGFTQRLRYCGRPPYASAETCETAKALSDTRCGIEYRRGSSSCTAAVSRVLLCCRLQLAGFSRMPTTPCGAPNGRFPRLPTHGY
jgi:hypothetical protein